MQSDAPPAGGFTLLELLISVLLAAVLAVLAVSAYRDHVLRAQRSDAHAALARVAAAQERHFLEHHRYASGFGHDPGGLDQASSSEHGHYALRLEVPGTGLGFVATAIPVGRQIDDRRCTSLSLDQTGRRGATGSAADAPISCWR